MDDCIFCKIIAGEVPVTHEYSDAEVVVFKSNKPLASVHLLIVPRKHITSLKEVGDEDEKVLGKIQITARKMAEKFGITDGYKVSINAGKYQEVPHLHYHLLSGFKEGGDI